MAGTDLFKDFVKKSDIQSLTILSGITWLFTTIIFRLFSIQDTSTKIIIPLGVATTIAWVRETRFKNDHHKHYVFRVIANGGILFIGAVMISKTFQMLGKLPSIDLAMYSSPAQIEHQQNTAHPETYSNGTSSKAVSKTEAPQVYEFWFKTNAPQRTNQNRPSNDNQDSIKK